ncbi:UDP-glucuronosyl/UDP-glucosyltransferase [Colletotrichum graminicola M1.001]|uniref:UDP-glucuronosyl/UDP-glucosyltransferase n=1 Tax=Colletotrichum graminicola (strain M1.001 / M2 / FGSC 10212) TaxID=645133 RepID=E3Q984_COLGM|nr:UDP-glucuronosyl/UDP-glucosyltransferase [Colletotrichum graminicola M1.001]EFQ27263.1 UDP-glucuronosyl/UDP-glucosyltransferase [Colletotrichum graminicola M1.001]
MPTCSPSPPRASTPAHSGPASSPDSTESGRARNALLISLFFRPGGPFDQMRQEYNAIIKSLGATQDAPTSHTRRGGATSRPAPRRSSESRRAPLPWSTRTSSSPRCRALPIATTSSLSPSWVPRAPPCPKNSQFPSMRGS